MDLPCLLRLAPGLAALIFSATVAPQDLQGHRGARGLAPENTLAAFDTALSLGVTTLELDAVVTRDETVVISHDPLLNPLITRDAEGRFLAAPGPAIRSLSLAELQRYDVGRLAPGTRYAQAHPEQRAVDGERIPTLAALFEAVARHGDRQVRFNIETKSSPLQQALTPEPDEFVRLVLEVADRHGVRDRISLQSFDWRTLAAAQRLYPDVPRVYLSAQQSWGNQVADPRWTGGLSLAEHGSVPRMVKAAGGAIWSPYFGDLTEAALGEARALGLKVVVWTVNEPAHIERMLELGVDGIISDRPDRVRAAMIARKLPVPKAGKVD
ncbi:MAG: glycerophosphodiester phosphodiesterase [Rhizobacter sp.]|nr:glycerophosphodiester phosphodiesterase [Rhizobacter sp.]